MDSIPLQNLTPSAVSIDKYRQNHLQQVVLHHQPCRYIRSRITAAGSPDYRKCFIDRTSSNAAVTIPPVVVVVGVNVGLAIAVLLTPAAGVS